MNAFVFRKPLETCLKKYSISVKVEAINNIFELEKKLFNFWSNELFVSRLIVNDSPKLPLINSLIKKVSQNHEHIAYLQNNLQKLLIESTQERFASPQFRWQTKCSRLAKQIFCHYLIFEVKKSLEKIIEQKKY
ncbi:hypothetical protein BpHYR1_005937 [Brachionus plicatilis]|uniref:Uncharacterized protein n=1 Tax=Brachionus plicatilis TaxID=10195 RepID=A0A3M7SRB5_BRAPC|nr:hypothetical protein BpHYR1_005937 [Brachionus plicatilis]